MKTKRLSQVRIGDTILDLSGREFKVETIYKFRVDPGRPENSKRWYDIGGTLTESPEPGWVLLPAIRNGIPTKVETTQKAA